MIAFPNAKINIGLNITERRADGYHNLETVFYPVNIYDALELVRADEMGFTASGLGIPGNAADNLCLKGYALLKRDFDLPSIKVHLHKNIPIGAGLGGGSADAGFFIKLLNAEFSLRLTDGQMQSYARQLGADCAFFIENKPVFAFEKGDRFKPLDINLSAYSIALVMPPVQVSTAQAYRGVRPRKPLYDLSTMIGKPVADWKKFIKNDFEESVFKNHPAIRGIKSALYEAGALYASMSGSGASVFGIFTAKPDLSALAAKNQVFYNV